MRITEYLNIHATHPGKCKVRKSKNIQKKKFDSFSKYIFKSKLLYSANIYLFKSAIKILGKGVKYV